MEFTKDSPSTIQALPPELLTLIFSFLAGPAPSDSRLHDEPSPAMLVGDGPESNFLKAVSLVSRRWRATALPLLFRHVVWSFDRWELLLVEPDTTAEERDPFSVLPLLAFLRANYLGRYVDTLTLVVGDSKQGMYRLPSAGSSLDSTGPFPRKPVPDLSTPPWPVTLAEVQSGLGGGQRPNRQERDRRYDEDSNWFWERLFQIMDPKRFTMIASPRMLASLLSRMLFVGDAWSFKNQWHILSLSREDRRLPENEDSPSESEARPSMTPSTGSAPTSHSCHVGSKPIDTVLFTIRPWTSLLLNEGSSSAVYTTYEFFLKRPPSILGALLGCEESPNDRPMIPPSIRNLSYVAVFPLSSHFSSLVAHLPPIDRLFVQIVPRPGGILDDPDRMRCIDPSDLWMERNTCYSLIMRRLFDAADGEAGIEGSADAGINSWLSLREFESGDAADKEAWDMAVHYVRMSRSGWRVEREGVFVRGAPGDRSEEESNGSPPPTNNMESFELLSVQDPPPDNATVSRVIEANRKLSQGLLERFAFNGVSRLPYSSMGHYGYIAATDD